MTYQEGLTVQSSVIEGWRSLLNYERQKLSSLPIFDFLTR